MFSRMLSVSGEIPNFSSMILSGSHWLWKRGAFTASWIFIP